jgi:hypothetical protein
VLILFDHGTPKGLIPALPGHTVHTAQAKEWDALSNGALLKAAEEAGFDVLLTTDRHLRLQAANCASVVGEIALGLLLCRQGHGNPHIGEFRHRIRPHVRRPRIREQRRHHADDFIYAAAKSQLTRQDVGGPAERCLPQAMANDRDTRTSEAVIVWSEDSADFRLGIECSIEIAADTGPADAFSGVTTDES